MDGIFTIGRAQLSELILNEKNPLGSSRLAKLKQIFDEGKSLQLQFPAEDLGFRYQALFCFLVYKFLGASTSYFEQKIPTNQFLTFQLLFPRLMS